MTLFSHTIHYTFRDTGDKFQAERTTNFRHPLDDEDVDDLIRQQGHDPDECDSIYEDIEPA